MYVSEGPEVGGKSRVQDERCLSGGAYVYTPCTRVNSLSYFTYGEKNIARAFL